MEKVYAIEIVNVEECIAFFAKNDKEVIKIAADEYGVKRSDVVILESRPATELEVAMNTISSVTCALEVAFGFDILMQQSAELLAETIESVGAVNTPAWYTVQKSRELKELLKEISALNTPRDLPNTSRFKNEYARLMMDVLTEFEKASSKRQYDSKLSKLFRAVKATESKVGREKEQLIKD